MSGRSRPQKPQIKAAPRPRRQPRRPQQAIPKRPAPNPQGFDWVPETEIVRGIPRADCKAKERDRV
jgi:hypothetical protein